MDGALNYLGLGQLPVFVSDSGVAEFNDNVYEYGFQYRSPLP
jgi:hypothetical protein